MFSFYLYLGYYWFAWHAWTKGESSFCSFKLWIKLTVPQFFCGYNLFATLIGWARTKGRARSPRKERTHRSAREERERGKSWIFSHKTHTHTKKESATTISHGEVDKFRNPQVPMARRSPWVYVCVFVWTGNEGPHWGLRTHGSSWASRCTGSTGATWSTFHRCSDGLLFAV